MTVKRNQFEKVRIVGEGLARVWKSTRYFLCWKSSKPSELHLFSDLWPLCAFALQSPLTPTSGHCLSGWPASLPSAASCSSPSSSSWRRRRGVKTPAGQLAKYRRRTVWLFQCRNVTFCDCSVSAQQDKHWRCERTWHYQQQPVWYAPQLHQVGTRQETLKMLL